MTSFYNPKKTRNLFDPNSKKPFRISRSKIDLFLNCRRCFYFDRRLGIGRPPGFPFNLNSAVDTLLKKEFDAHRAQGSSHPMMKFYGIEAVPFQHEKMDEWRDSLHRGITFLHPATNLLVTGGVDDVWVNTNGELIIVDYKATSKSGEVSLDAGWQIGYKRQMEIYQWLFRQNGFGVSPVGYFVYCNGRSDKEAFDAKLEFDVKIIAYEGKTDWIEGTMEQIVQCLSSSEKPKSSRDCDYCAYVRAIRKEEKTAQKE